MFFNNSKWVTLFKSATNIYLKDLVIQGDYFLAKNSKLVRNMFWKDTLSYWLELQKYQNPQSVDDVQCINIWNNSKICIDNKPFIYKNYINNGIIFINDLLNLRRV